jgi:MOSC domain-containing protein YiiM
MHPVAEVAHLFQSIARGEPVREFGEVFAVENQGFQDCLHGRSGKQVLVTDIETLEEFGIPPGSGKENITTRGIALAELPPGQRMRVGEALLEVGKPCTTCHLMDEVRDGLRKAIRGRRGVICRVVVSGRIRRGDQIEIVKGTSAKRNRNAEQNKGAIE